MDLHDFQPMYIRRDFADKPRHVVTAEQWNELWTLVTQQGDHNSEALQAVAEILNNNVLTKDNTEAYTPTENFHPATRKFVTDHIAAMGGGNMLKAVYDTDNSGIVDNAERLGGQLPAYYAKQEDLFTHLTNYATYSVANNNINTKQTNDIADLLTRLRKQELKDSYPIKNVDFTSAKALRTAGAFTLGEIALERVYDFAYIQFTVGKYDNASSENVNTSESGILYVPGLCITPGFSGGIIELAHPNITDGNSVYVEKYVAYFRTATTSTGATTFGCGIDWEDTVLFVEQKDNKLLIKVANCSADYYMFSVVATLI